MPPDPQRCHSHHHPVPHHDIIPPRTAGMGQDSDHRAQGEPRRGCSRLCSPARLYSLSLLPYKTTPQALYSGTARWGRGGRKEGSKNKQRGLRDRAAGGGWHRGTRQGGVPNPLRRHCPWGGSVGVKCPSVEGDLRGSSSPSGAPRVFSPLLAPAGHLDLVCGRWLFPILGDTSP